MMMDLKTMRVDCLLVYSVDRFGRDLKNNIETMLCISESVKQIIFITENITSTGEYFKMFFLLLTAMSQEERERILKRVSDGRKAKVLSRLAYDGKYPFGYIKSKDDEKILPVYKEITSDEEKQKEIYILQYIFYGYLMKMSLRNIARIINERFGPTKRGKK
ncbi:recombinase family protein [Bacillus sp. CGMCC 1.16607]|uniref:recombinase family protein n=1 Tax=Bacillus sp. CGMCC 1.16607 TaxID=3351842 RepID=UPI00363A4C69